MEKVPKMESKDPLFVKKLRYSDDLVSKDQLAMKAPKSPQGTTYKGAFVGVNGNFASQIEANKRGGNTARDYRGGGELTNTESIGDPSD